MDGSCALFREYLHQQLTYDYYHSVSMIIDYMSSLWDSCTVSFAILYEIHNFVNQSTIQRNELAIKLQYDGLDRMCGLRNARRLRNHTLRGLTRCVELPLRGAFWASLSAWRRSRIFLLTSPTARQIILNVGLYIFIYNTYIYILNSIKSMEN